MKRMKILLYMMLFLGMFFVGCSDDDEDNHHLYYILTVVKEGTGSGLVTSVPDGIYCGNDCKESYSKSDVEYEDVALTATPDEGSEFVGWGGYCSGTGTCAIEMDHSWAVYATFNKIAPAVKSTTPANGALSVKLESSMIAIFNDDMDCSTIDSNSFLLRKGGDYVDGTISCEGPTAIFTPDDDLECGATYTAIITAGVKDADGLVSTEDYIWSFTTIPCGSAEETFTAALDPDFGRATQNIE